MTRSPLAAIAPLALFLACSVACEAAGPASGAPGGGVSADRAPYPSGARSQAPEGFWEHWGDGRAELSGFTLRQPRYGQVRMGEAVLIVVTETFTAAQRVKSDGGHDDEYPVLKLNEVRDFQTGIYDYNLMTSAFLRLDGRARWGVPTKLTMSMQEWCGAAFDQLLFGPGSFERDGHSYFDGEGDRRGSQELGVDAVFADALPLLVRGLTGDPVAAGESREVSLWPRLSEVRMNHSELAPTQAKITRSAGTAPVDSVLGSVEAETWTVEGGGTTLSYSVEAAAPRRLLGWRSNTGEEAVLTGVSREKYWQQHDEGQEVLRGKLGLPAQEWPTRPAAATP